MGRHVVSDGPLHAGRAALVCVLMVGCGGTPTADPPDFLPTPNAGRIGVTPEIVTAGGPDDLGPIDLIGEPSAVEPSADLWITNLDQLQLDAQLVKPNADGSFLVKVQVRAGDRVRLVSRTEDRHSLPFDLEAVRGFDSIVFSPLRDPSLACLKITPSGELDLGNARVRSAKFALENECDSEITIERSVLRFARPKLSFVSPMRIAQDSSAEITVNLEGDLSAELWDILLLDVATADERGRYALSLWAR